jgi:hypothetical protein
MLKHLRELANPDMPVRSIEVQARAAAEAQPQQPNQFRLLVSHLLDRFFNNEMVTVGGETLPLIMTVAGVIAVPTLIAAIFAYPPYHAFPPRPPVPPYWDRTAEHLLYVVYSLVAMGAVTVFEADMLFPNLLDILVLSTLPIPHRRLVLARVVATLLFLTVFLFGVNSLGIVAYPSATEFHVKRLMWAHFVAVTAAGTFAAAVFLGLQGILICLLSGRMYRVASAILQGVSIALLLTMLFLFPAIYPRLGELIRSAGGLPHSFPPFWFLGIYECVLADPERLPVFASLAHTGWLAVLSAMLVAVVTYPLAYARRTRQAVEGVRSEATASAISGPANWLLHETILRTPARRAIYHFIGQTVRTPRHRVYLAMYAGFGAALIVAATVGIRVVQGHVSFVLFPHGLRLAVPGVAFWVVSGLYSALLSPADPSGGWVFHVIGGRPAAEQLDAVRLWVKVWALTVTLGVVVLLHFSSPPQLRAMNSTAAQMLVAAGVCLLLPEVLLFTSQSVPFTEARIPLNTDLAFVLLRYVAMFPAVVTITVACEPWLESKPTHLWGAAVAIAVGHEALRYAQRRFMSERMAAPEVYEAGGVIQALGLRE